MNETMKSIDKKKLPISLIIFDLSVLNVKASGAYNERTKQLYKKRHQCSLRLVMNYQSSKLGGEGSWNENVKAGLKVEIIYSRNLYDFFNVC